MPNTALIIDHLPDHAATHHLHGKQEDTLVLTSEQRRWVRGRFTTAQGREIALALPTGTVLSPGAILVVESDWYLKILAAPEPVLAVLPSDNKDAIRIAFEVGNRHFPLALQENLLLVPDDTAMVQLFERLGVHFERRNETFHPIGHTHRHAH
ncbi:MAG TPA: urease accessory protein UreE [Candidatus Acidoferrum sp.]|nr:urease accessory protein UreE [Candidatus Acidoferrum sp.]